MRKQMDIPRPLAKQAWANIVRRKIENQSACLRFCAKNGVDRMDSYVRRVRSGDMENLEGQAAAFYFTQLFGQGFYRAEARWANAALDYGYAVLRGAIARGLVAHGMHPPIGLFHASEQNAFNLADDLIEPFRPLVDLHVAKHPAMTEGDLAPQDKAALVALLNVDVGMPQGKMSALSAIEYAVESLVRLFEQGDSDLELPTLIGLQAHRLEC
jgi:CRISPR-associated protein Cas1